MGPFRAIIDIDNGIVTKENKVLNHSKSCLMQETRRQDSKTSLLKESIMNNSRSRLMKDVGLGQNEPESQNSPTSHLVWDSTFEAIKTLETSMKLLVTPYSNKVKSRKGIKDDGVQEEHVSLIKPATRDSSSSIATNDTPDRVNYTMIFKTSLFLSYSLNISSKNLFFVMLNIPISICMTNVLVL